MNTASQDLPRHLGVLRERMLHPTDYERAFHYFLEEFAGDLGFMNQSQAKDAPHLLTVLTHVAAKALGKLAPLEQARIFHLPQFKFLHGAAAVVGRVVSFFYFEEADAGLLALIPGTRGGMELGRFRLIGGLADPRQN
jgi:hypothetical protein